MGLIKSLKALTWDATATADKVLSGFSAYAKGEKLNGTASGGGGSKYFQVLVFEHDEKDLIPTTIPLMADPYISVRQGE